MLESLLSSVAPPIHLTPATRESSIAADWFRRFEGAGLDGVVAKPVAGSYESNKRVMLKVKHERDCDCVVAGFRWHKKGERSAVGSLLLGLFDDSGALQHVGVCASFTEKKRRELVEFLAPYRKNALAAHPWKNWAEQAPANGEGEQRMSFFVSSTGSKTVNLGGLRGADKLCQDLASAVGLGNRTWRAYLSAERDPDNGNKPTDARSRIGTGPWSNAKGVVVAKNLDELHARKGDADLFVDERGQRVPGNWPDSPKPTVHG